MSATLNLFSLASLRRILPALFLAALSVAPTPAKAIEIGNRSMRLLFDDKSGALLGITDTAFGQSLCEPKPGQGALWQLSFEGTNQAVTPFQARTFRAERTGAAGDAATLTWSDFAPALPRLRVRAFVRLDQTNGLARWSLAVSGLEEAPLKSVVYPRLQNLQPRTNETVAVPMWLGEMLHDPRARISGPNRQASQFQWAYPGHLSLQCFALYGEGTGGLYIACNDTAAFRKNFLLRGDSERGLHAEVEHLPERAGHSTEWVMPYEVVAGAFQGDWVTAAETYRAWATNQVWAKQSRVARGLVPSWVKDTGLWVWNRGTSKDVLEPAVELQKQLDLPVSVFWHWWHGCSYDAGFPEYFPPREGTEPFKRALTQAHAHKVRALVYMNQRIWGMNTPSWRDTGAAAFAVKDAQGKIQPEIYNTFTQAACAAMCMGTEFWRNTYAGLAERAVRDLDVDGIYMDQACTSLACYDPKHPHPPGGGKYWMEGFQKMQQNIRNRCAAHPISRPPALAGEGCGEPWLPYLDIMLSLQVSKERYAGPDGWEPIPFFHAVYHAYAVSYGNYSSLTMPPYDELWPVETAPKEPLKLLDRKFSDQFYLEQARAFIWGQQPTIANFLPSLLEQRSNEISYVVRLAKLRSKARSWLQDGTFLRPPKLGASVRKLEMSRLSIYAGQQAGVREFQMESPAALASAWRSPTGDVAIALASITGERVSISMKVMQDYQIPIGTQMWRVDENGRARMGNYTGEPVSLSLPPLGACLVEFSRR